MVSSRMLKVSPLQNTSGEKADSSSGLSNLRANSSTFKIKIFQYFENFIFASPPRSCCTSLTSLPTQLRVSFSAHQVSLCCPSTLGSAALALKKTLSLSQQISNAKASQRGGILCQLPPLHAGILSGLRLYTSYACCHTCH